MTLEKWTALLVLILLTGALLFAVGCSDGSNDDDDDDDVVGPGPSDSSWASGGWVYWLEQIDLDPLVSLAPDCAVIDYASEGDEATEFSAADIARVTGAGTTTLCYLSIGEAEDYRWYWQEAWSTSPPSWLGPVNPDWAGNYKVRYWDEGWRSILFGEPSGDSKSYLDRIIDQGFDGVYLDIIDAYYYWSEEAPEAEQNPDAAHLMVELLDDIATYARETRGHSDFLIIPQNGDWLPEDAPESDKERYYSIVDGLGREEIFETGEYEMADEMVTRGKVVLSVEYESYVSTEADIAAYYQAALARGYVPLATVRDLDRLVFRDLGGN